MRKAELAALRVDAHSRYKTSLMGVFEPFGFTDVALAEFDKKGCYPALHIEAGNTLNSLKVPKGWRRLIGQIYPSPPVFVNRLTLTEDNVFMSLQLQNTVSGESALELRYPEKEGVREQLDPWMIIDWQIGDASYFKYVPGAGMQGRTNKILTAKQLDELSQFPQLVAAAPTVYPSSHKLQVVDMVDM